jgi:hypothetical protein
MSNEQTAQAAKPDKPAEKFFYFVDGDKYESDTENTTGAAIKAQLPESKRGYALYLEGHGNNPDTLINDDTTVSLEKDKGPKRLYTVPPATFGRT